MGTLSLDTDVGVAQCIDRYAEALGESGFTVEERRVGGQQGRGGYLLARHAERGLLISLAAGPMGVVVRYEEQGSRR